MDHDSSAIADAKAAIRREALARRDGLPADMRAAAAQAIAERPFPIAIAADAIVSGFMPLKSEINPVPLMRRLADAGAQLALPAIAGRGQPLTMRAYSFGQPLASGVWGIREPGPDAREVFPDIVIAPLLAFDRSGHRVGYGAGYYDMTIMACARKPVVAVGIAFAAQEIARVPTTARDAPRSQSTEHESSTAGRRNACAFFIGDIVGRSGRTVLLERLPRLVRDWRLDFVA
jgi:5-formyltetrahydrofolate cyclo-ligase